MERVAKDAFQFNCQTLHINVTICVGIGINYTDKKT